MQPSATATKEVEVTGLWVYPVKSCRGIALDEGHLNRYGFVHDREWMVVTQQLRDHYRSFVTMRQIPRMALITTRFDVRPSYFPPSTSFNVSLSFSDKINDQ